MNFFRLSDTLLAWFLNSFFLTFSKLSVGKENRDGKQRVNSSGAKKLFIARFNPKPPRFSAPPLLPRRWQSRSGFTKRTPGTDYFFQTTLGLKTITTVGSRSRPFFLVHTGKLINKPLGTLNMFWAQLVWISKYNFSRSIYTPISC